MIYLKGDPLGVPRNPLAIYLLLLAAVSGLGTVVGITTSGVVEDNTPTAAALAWGTILCLGSTATLVGMFWQGDDRTGLVLKRSGMFSVAAAAFMYGGILALGIGTAGLFAGGVVIGFGLACAVQFHLINKRIHAIIKLTREQANGS
jgi:hypothetical protein